MLDIHSPNADFGTTSDSKTPWNQPRSHGRFIKGIKYDCQGKNIGGKGGFKKGKLAPNWNGFKPGHAPTSGCIKPGEHLSPSTEFKDGANSPGAHKFELGHLPWNKLSTQSLFGAFDNRNQGHPG